MAWQPCLSGQNLATQWEKSIGIGAKMAKKASIISKKKVKHVLFISLWPWLQKWGYGTTEFEHNIALQLRSASEYGVTIHEHTAWQGQRHNLLLF